MIENTILMSDQAIEARRAYKRDWNRRNPDKVRAAQARYWERKAAQKEEDKTNGMDKER